MTFEYIKILSKMNIYVRSVPTLGTKTDLSFYYDYLLAHDDDGSNIPDVPNDSDYFIVSANYMIDAFVFHIGGFSVKDCDQDLDRNVFLYKFLIALFKSDFFSLESKIKLLVHFLAKMRARVQAPSPSSRLKKMAERVIENNFIQIVLIEPDLSSIHVKLLYDLIVRLTQSELPTGLMMSRNEVSDAQRLFDILIALFKVLSENIETRDLTRPFIHSDRHSHFFLDMIHLVYSEEYRIDNLSKRLSDFLLNILFETRHFNDHISTQSEYERIINISLLNILSTFFFSMSETFYSKESMQAIFLFLNAVKAVAPARYPTSSPVTRKSTILRKVTASSRRSSYEGSSTSLGADEAGLLEVLYNDTYYAKLLFELIFKISKTENKISNLNYFLSRTELFPLFLNSVICFDPFFADSIFINLLYSSSPILSEFFYFSSSRIFLSVIDSYDDFSVLLNNLNNSLNTFLSRCEADGYQHYDSLFANVYYQVCHLNKRVYSIIFSDDIQLTAIIYHSLVPYFIFLNNTSQQLFSLKDSNHFNAEIGCYLSVIEFLLQSLKIIQQLILSLFKFDEVAFYAYILNSSGLKDSKLSELDSSMRSLLSQYIQDVDLPTTALNIETMRYVYSPYSDSVIHTTSDMATEDTIQQFLSIINSPGLPEVYLFSNHAITFMLRLTCLLSQAQSESDKLLKKKYNDLPLKMINMYYSALEMHYSMKHKFVLPYKLSLSFYSLLLSRELFFHNASLTDKSLYKGLLYYLYFYSNSTFRDWLEESLNSANDFITADDLTSMLSGLFDLSAPNLSVDLILSKLDGLISHNDFIQHHASDLLINSNMPHLPSQSSSVSLEGNETSDVIMYESSNMKISITEQTLSLGC